jgi:hypothetical protein
MLKENPPEAFEVEEGFNGEYDNEAGMAQGNLYTIAKAAEGLLDTIDDRDNLPEWVQEKIAKVEGMMVGAWNYMQSQKAQGIDPKVDEAVTAGSPRVDSLVTDALKIMRGSELNDAVLALKTVLGDREYNSRRGYYNFYIRQLLDMYGQQGVAETRRMDSYEKDVHAGQQGMGRPADHRGLRQELAHEKNNLQVTINGKPWKVIPGKGYADSQEERSYLRNMQSWAEKKSASTGKKWSVSLTGADVSESQKKSDLDEVSTELLGRYKTAAAADAKKSDAAGNYKRGDKRFSGIVKATNKQFANDLKKHSGVAEGQLDELFEPTLNYYKLSNGKTVQASYRPTPNQSPVPFTDVEVSYVNPALKPQGGSFDSTGVAEPWTNAPDGVKQAIQKFVAQPQQGVAEGDLDERNMGQPRVAAAKPEIVSATDDGKTITVRVRAPDGTTRSIANSNPAVVQQWLNVKYGLRLPGSIARKFVGMPASMAEGEVTKTTTGLRHRATDKYGAGNDEPHHYTGGRSGFSDPGKYARDLEHVNKQLVKDLDASMGISWKNRGTKGVEVDEQGVAEVKKKKKKKSSRSQGYFFPGYAYYGGGDSGEGGGDGGGESTNPEMARGRGRPTAGEWDQTSGKAGRVEKTATGIRHHADPSRYGGTEPDRDDNRLLSKAQIIRLGKATEPEVDEGWKSRVAGAALAGAAALGAGGAQARVTPDGQGGFTGGLKPTTTVTSPSNNTPAQATAPMSREKAQAQFDIETRILTYKGKQYKWDPQSQATGQGEVVSAPSMAVGSRSMGPTNVELNPNGTYTKAAINEDSSTSSSDVESAVTRRILTQHTDLLMKYGPQKVMQAIEEVAYNVGDLDEIGTSDISSWVQQVKRILGAA